MPIQYPKHIFPYAQINETLKRWVDLGYPIYDFGGGSYIVPAPSGTLRINGEDKHDIYILAFNKDETNARTDTDTRN